MSSKTVFSGFALLAILSAWLFFCAAATGQNFKFRKSAIGRVESRRETRGNSSNDEFRIHYLVNNERRRKGLGDLYWNDELARPARSYSRQMARESFFSHFDRSGHSVVERALRSGIDG
jgi:uncharacterized protein YkwD